MDHRVLGSGNKLAHIYNLKTGDTEKVSQRFFLSVFTITFLGFLSLRRRLLPRRPPSPNGIISSTGVAVSPFGVAIGEGVRTRFFTTIGVRSSIRGGTICRKRDGRGPSIVGDALREATKKR